MKKNEIDESLAQEKQKFDVLAVPCSRAFVISPEKAEEFKNKKSNLVVTENIRNFAEKVRKNNLTDGPVLIKLKK